MRTVKRRPTTGDSMVISMMGSMSFYADIDPNGCYHVQNAIMGLRGQHHVHTKDAFLKWSKQIKKENLHVGKEPRECGCGLKPGFCREYDGHVWHNDRFGD